MVVLSFSMQFSWKIGRLWLLMGLWITLHYIQLVMLQRKFDASIRVKSVFCNCATLWSTIFYAFSGAHVEEKAALKYINIAKLRKRWDGKCTYCNNYYFLTCMS